MKSLRTLCMEYLATHSHILALRLGVPTELFLEIATETHIRNYPGSSYYLALPNINILDLLMRAKVRDLSTISDPKNPSQKDMFEIEDWTPTVLVYHNGNLRPCTCCYHDFPFALIKYLSKYGLEEWCLFNSDDFLPEEAALGIKEGMLIGPIVLPDYWVN